jgi:outer membrane protein assembly factor BamB
VNRIPRGFVIDGRLAVVHDNEGAVVALDPRTGEVRWRHGRGLRPCASAGGMVVAVSVRLPVSRGAAALGVVVLAEDDGRELWSAPAVELPDWARPAWTTPPSSQ